METTIEVADPSHVAEGRRAVALIGHSMSLEADLVARAALVMSELASNILKYAKAGTLTVSTVDLGAGHRGLDVIALDRGPGIPSVDTALRDGYSTGGSLGLGLGTLRRAAAVFDVYTRPGLGTAIFVRLIASRTRPQEGALFEVGARATPIRGETVSGDAWSALPFGRSLALTVVDGLGHGPGAARAATAAVDTFASIVRLQGPAGTLRAAHEALRQTRGAVMAVGVIDLQAQMLCFSGIGNISAVLLGGETVVRLQTSDGTVGFGTRTAREFRHAWTAGSVLVLNSDGLSTRWNLLGHPGLLACRPMLIAAVLHRDFARDNDDATVVVVKNAAP